MSYPIEFYSLEFDKQYIEEEEVHVPVYIRVCVYMYMYCTIKSVIAQFIAGVPALIAV